MLHIILLILKILGFLILVLAGLIAKGKTEVTDIEYILRGYEKLFNCRRIREKYFGKAAFLLDKTVYFGRNLL